MNGMTIKEIAELAGVSRDSVERTVRDLYPSLMEKGKATVLDHKQSVSVMEKVRKANMVALPQNAEVLPQNAEVLLAKLADLKIQYTAMVEKVKALEAAPARLALPAPVVDEETIKAVKAMSDSGQLQDRDVRRLLHLDETYTPPVIPRGDYVIGNLQDLTERLLNVPFWPMRYTTLAKQLKLRDELAYRVARMCKVEPDAITAEGAMKMARLITCTPEPKQLPGAKK